MKSLAGRPPKLYKFGGVSLSLTDWAEVSGVARYTIINRMEAGWSFPEAIIYLSNEFPPGRGRGRYARRAARALEAAAQKVGA